MEMKLKWYVDNTCKFCKWRITCSHLKWFLIWLQLLKTPINHIHAAKNSLAFGKNATSIESAVKWGTSILYFGDWAFWLPRQQHARHEPGLVIYDIHKKRATVTLWAPPSLLPCQNYRFLQRTTPPKNKGDENNLNEKWAPALGRRIAVRYSY